MTFDGRSAERMRRVVKTGVSGIGAHAVMVGTSLAMVPLGLRYLGTEGFGIWTAASSLVAMIGFVDGGAGNAAINLVAHASGKDRNDLPGVVSTAFFSLTGLAALVGLLFFSVSGLVSWARLLGVTDPMIAAKTSQLIVLVGMFFFVRIPLALVSQVQRGLQEGEREKFTAGAGAILSLCFAYLAAHSDSGMLGFAVGVLLGPTIAHLANSVLFFWRWHPELRPSLHRVNSSWARQLFGAGSMFLVIQIAGSAQLQADNVIISNMLGPSAVVSFSVTRKLFMLASTLFGLFLMPLWPAYREAIASGDRLWVSGIYLRSLKWSLLLAVPLACILGLLGAPIISIWAGASAVPSASMLLGCASWMVLSIIGMGLAALLNSLQLLAIQIRVAALATLANIGLTVVLIRQIGVEGAIWGSVISYASCSLVPWFFVVRKQLRKLQEVK